MKRWVFLLCVGMLSGTATLFAQSSSPGTPPAAHTTARISRLTPGDMIHLRVYNKRGDAEIDQELIVNDSGDLDIPLVGFVNVAGHPTTELHDILNKVLSETAFKCPRIQVSVVKLAMADRVYVWGGVKNPGPIKIRDHISLMDAVKQAGGFYDEIMTAGHAKGTNLSARCSNMSMNMITQTLDYLDEAKVKRGGKEIPIKLKRLIHDADMTQNIELRPDDVLLIPSRIFVSPKTEETVYVLGAVARPARYKFRQNMTVLDAINMAGGLVNPRRIRFVSIVRNRKKPQSTQDGNCQPSEKKVDETSPEIIQIDLCGLLNRGDVQQDQKLQGGDLVLFSSRPFRNMEFPVSLQ
ncbi:MAG: SLBB domain-containing protein [Candidatus Ozemobacteraceae bacterium]